MGFKVVLIPRARVYNVKSIKELDMELRPLTIFIGPNASGKSTILQSIYWFYIKTLHNPNLTSEINTVECELFNVREYDDIALNRDLRKVWMGVEPVSYTHLTLPTN